MICYHLEVCISVYSLFQPIISSGKLPFSSESTIAGEPQPQDMRNTLSDTKYRTHFGVSSMCHPLNQSASSVARSNKGWIAGGTGTTNNSSSRIRTKGKSNKKKRAHGADEEDDNEDDGGGDDDDDSDASDVSADVVGMSDNDGDGDYVGTFDNSFLSQGRYMHSNVIIYINLIQMIVLMYIYYRFWHSKVIFKTAYGRIICSIK